MPLICKTLAEWSEVAAANRQKPRRRFASAQAYRQAQRGLEMGRRASAIGHWRYGARQRYVWCDLPAAWGYGFDLTPRQTPAAILDMMCQVRKAWFLTPDLMTDFLAMLEAIVRDVFDTNLQGALCPWGEPRRLDWRTGERQRLTYTPAEETR